MLIKEFVCVSHEVAVSILLVVPSLSSLLSFYIFHPGASSVTDCHFIGVDEGKKDGSHMYQDDYKVWIRILEVYTWPTNCL